MAVLQRFYCTNLSRKDQKLVFKTNYNCLMQVKSITECSSGAFCNTFCPSLSYQIVIKIFVLSIFEWLFYTGSTVHDSTDVSKMHNNMTILFFMETGK